MDDFLWRAVLGAGFLAAAAGPLGCFVLWRRMAYLGESVSHVGLLGVGAGILIGVDPLVGTAVLAVIAALTMAQGQARLIPADTHVGIIGHIALALGFILLAGMDTVRADLLGYLFGDVLALSETDILLIAGASILVLGLTVFLWRPLLTLSAGGDIAAAEGKGKWPQTAFLLLVALLVALGLKVVGALLIVALIIIPPAAARPFAKSPEQMALMAAAAGALSAPLGLAGSYLADVPAGPSIVLAAGALYALSAVAARIISLFPAKPT
jgi:zinc transport system permease protein